MDMNMGIGGITIRDINKAHEIKSIVGRVREKVVSMDIKDSVLWGDSETPDASFKLEKKEHIVNIGLKADQMTVSGMLTQKGPGGMWMRRAKLIYEQQSVGSSLPGAVVKYILISNPGTPQESKQIVEADQKSGKILKYEKQGAQELPFD